MPTSPLPHTDVSALPPLRPDSPTDWHRRLLHSPSPRDLRSSSQGRAREKRGKMAQLLETYACSPATERGRGILLAGDPKTDAIAYCTGCSVIIRRLDAPLDAWVYPDHAYPTTVARFFPNGEWVASADASVSGADTATAPSRLSSTPSRATSTTSASFWKKHKGSLKLC